MDNYLFTTMEKADQIIQTVLPPSSTVPYPILVISTSITASSPPVTETVAAEELEVFRKFRASLSRSFSIPKNAKTNYGLDDLLQALSAMNIGLSDLDYNSQQDIPLDMDSYTNHELMRLRLVCTCFTDVTYWQIIFVLTRWPRDKSRI